MKASRLVLGESRLRSCLPFLNIKFLTIQFAAPIAKQYRMKASRLVLTDPPRSNGPVSPKIEAFADFDARIDETFKRFICGLRKGLCVCFLPYSSVYFGWRWAQDPSKIILAMDHLVRDEILRVHRYSIECLLDKQRYENYCVASSVSWIPGLLFWIVSRHST